MTDTSDVGIAAILSTKQGTLVEFVSRVLTTAEKKYTTTEKEYLAIVWAVCKFYHFLLGVHKQIRNH